MGKETASGIPVRKDIVETVAAGLDMEKATPCNALELWVISLNCKTLNSSYQVAVDS